MIKKQTSKFVLLVVAILMFITNLALLYPIFNNRTDLTVSANAINNYANQIDLANGEFTSTSGSSSVATPSSWTKKEGTNANEVKAGVIDISNAKFSKNAEDYGISSNPGAPVSSTSSQNNNILMINSEDYAT